MVSTGYSVLPLGSPPLTRERLFFSTLSKNFLGITPAHAGKTTCSTLCQFCSQDHPRSRGKDQSSIFCDFRHLGSPPLTRERPPTHGRLAKVAGITPAHAGKTSRPHYHAIIYKDHPRSRGKDMLLYQMLKQTVGSPPLTRERLLVRVF